MSVPTAVAVRPGLASDLTAVVALERAAGVRAFVGSWTEEQHASALAGDRYEHLVVERDGAFAGYAILDRAPAARAGVPAGAVDLLRIAVATRGAGVGSAAVGAIIRRLEAGGSPAISLDVLDDNPRARSVYERCGFVAVGGPVPVLDGRPGRLMVRPCGRPAATDGVVGASAPASASRRA